MIKFCVGLIAMLIISVANAKNITLTEDNCVVFNQPVSAEYTSKKLLEILQKSKKSSSLYLVLDTPGGSVMDGLNFIDALNSLPIQVHTITVFAASMGYQMVQELGNRYIIPSGVLMSHRGAVSGVSGQIPGELNTRVQHIQSVLSDMSERAAKRVGMSKSQYDAAIVNELWVSGKNAVNAKHADEVVGVLCNKDLLEKTYSEEVATIFGGITVTFSKCPLVTFPVAFSFSKEIKPENFAMIKRMIINKKKNVHLTF